MDIINIKGSLRAETGKKATKALIRAEHVPCVVYGGKENIHFEALGNEFNKIVFTDKVFIIKLEIEGKETLCIMKDIQFNPVTDRIRHIDFLEISDKKEFLIDIPVNYVGQPIGAQAGGNFSKRRRYLTVKGLLNNIPNTLDIEVAHLEIGQSLRIGDVEVKDIVVVDSDDLTLCSVNVSRAALKAEEEEGEEGAEGAEAAATEAEGDKKE